MNRYHYEVGFRLALSAAGMTKHAALPAEALATTLDMEPPAGEELPPRRVSRKKDPKDPAGPGSWSEAGPFGGDMLTNLGLNIHAVSDFYG